MKLETATAIVKAGTSLGYDMEVREGYTGRVMRGEAATAAVVGCQAEIVEAIVEAAVRMAVAEPEKLAILQSNVAAGRLRWDNAGRPNCAAY